MFLYFPAVPISVLIFNIFIGRKYQEVESMQDRPGKFSSYNLVMPRNSRNVLFCLNSGEFFF